MVRIIQLLGVLILFSSYTERSTFIELKAYYNQQEIVLNDTFLVVDANQGTRINSLKFYLSDFKLLKEQSVVWSQDDWVKLVDFSNKRTSTFSLPITSDINFNAISFNLGIDSVTNVSGAFGDDLDPTNGMYWTWQSGYINLKFEGKLPINKGKAKNFEFHLGGYAYPYNSITKVVLPVNCKSKIEIAWNANKFLNTLDSLSSMHVMSPNVEAVRLSKNAAASFYINQ